MMMMMMMIVIRLKLRVINSRLRQLLQPTTCSQNLAPASGRLRYVMPGWWCNDNMI